MPGPARDSSRRILPAHACRTSRRATTIGGLPRLLAARRAVSRNFRERGTRLMESDLIRWLRHRLPGHSRLLVGPGDDAAVLGMGGRDGCVLTVDLLTDGVDFELAKVDAAPGRPQGAGREPERPGRYGCPAASRRDRVGPAPRRRARAGQGAVRGVDSAGRAIRPGHRRRRHQQLGRPAGDQRHGGWRGDRAGPCCAAAPSRATPSSSPAALAAASWGIISISSPAWPRHLLLAERYPLHAGIDTSDGLSLDLSRIAQESGCGAVIELDQVPVAAAASELAAQAG